MHRVQLKAILHNDVLIDTQPS